MSSRTAGLRPTIFKICNEAPAGAAVGGEAQPVFAYYFHQCGRDDLHYSVLSDAHGERCRPHLPSGRGRQENFENISFIEAITSEQAPVWTTGNDGSSGATVYRTPN